MNRKPPTIGVILVGGQARRFGGVRKGSLMLAGKTLLDRVVERIAPQVECIVLNTGDDPEGISLPGVSVIPDRPCVTPATGPLIGLTSVFATLSADGSLAEPDSPILSVPVDTPFLPMDLVARLAENAKNTGASVAFTATTERDHPIIALWTAAARDALRTLFHQSPEISLHGVMTQMGAIRVIFDEIEGVDPFFNVNTPADLERAALWLTRPHENDRSP